MYDRGYKQNEISGWRYRELKAILMKYDERQAMIKDAIHLPKAVPDPDGMHTMGGFVQDPTAKAAEKIARLKGINDKIDKVVRQIDQGRILMKCVGYNKALELGFEGGKNEYYDKKRLMFVRLDRAFQ